MSPFLCTMPTTGQWRHRDLGTALWGSLAVGVEKDTQIDSISSVKSSYTAERRNTGLVNST